MIGLLFMPLIWIAGGAVIALLETWDIIGPLGMGVCAAILLIGAFYPNPYRKLFGYAIVGLVIGFVIGGGVWFL